jgi:hypothetical protein
METAPFLSPDFAEVRKKRDALIDRPSTVQQAIALNKRIKREKRPEVTSVLLIGQDHS